MRTLQAKYSMMMISWDDLMKESVAIVLSLQARHIIMVDSETRTLTHFEVI